SQQGGPRTPGPALRACGARLCRGCLPGRCLRASQGALGALHRLGEGRVATWLLDLILDANMGLRDKETARYALLLMAAAAVSAANASLLWSTPGGPGRPEAAYLLATLALALGCCTTSLRSGLPPLQEEDSNRAQRK
ncbi:unnamed protein product, partial [Prorocentrum cordatum]